MRRGRNKESYQTSCLITDFSSSKPSSEAQLPRLILVSYVIWVMTAWDGGTSSSLCRL